MSKVKAAAARTPLEKLKAVTAIATAPGNYDARPYLHGMANGLILALAIAEGREPEYLDTPKQWLNDRSGSDPDALVLAAGQLPGVAS